MINKNTKAVAKMLKSLKSEEKLALFLEGLLTPGELTQLSVRLEIVNQLRQGKTQREIAENLNIGLATVTRGARELRMGKFDVVDDKSWRHWNYKPWR